MLHEMRAPLNAVLGYAELILDNAYGETTDEMRDALHKVRQRGYSMAELINAAFALELSKRRLRDVAEQERK
jgi:signal transduction histidine kinase